MDEILKICLFYVWCLCIKSMKEIDHLFRTKTLLFRWAEWRFGERALAGTVIAVAHCIEYSFGSGLCVFTTLASISTEFDGPPQIQNDLPNCSAIVSLQQSDSVKYAGYIDIQSCLICDTLGDYNINETSPRHRVKLSRESERKRVKWWKCDKPKTMLRRFAYIVFCVGGTICLDTGQSVSIGYCI